MKEIAKKVIVEKLSKMEIENALTIIKKFEIDTSDETLKAEAQNKFDDIVDSGRFDIAAELGMIFKLDAGKTKEAAFKSWEKHIRNGRYDKAANIKREYKIPIAWIKPVAKEIYDYNLQISKSDIAQKIRSEYNLESGIIDLIREFFKKFVSMKIILEIEHKNLLLICGLYFLQERVESVRLPSVLQLR